LDDQGYQELSGRCLEEEVRLVVVIYGVEYS